MSYQGIFIASENYLGSRRGMDFKNGPCGVGYYERYIGYNMYNREELVKEFGEVAVADGNYEDELAKEFSKRSPKPEIYDIIKEYLCRQGKSVMYIEKMNGKTVNEYEHPNPSLKMMAYKLMLLAEEERKEKKLMKEVVKNDLEMLEKLRSEGGVLRLGISNPNTIEHIPHCDVDMTAMYS